ncbi:unnamed protein product [Blepharisma stoltei]|uniref:Uncharacterized protein n=1 Tax=Blepharisma stoltei TaxID=1481888 RepID=A0AAU9JN96_9CILI|nr:unnamed protein product [Blepharisma stoltei]
MEGWKYELFDCGRNPFMFIWSICMPCGYHCMQTCDAKHAEPENRFAGLRAYSLVLFLGPIGASINRYMLRKTLKIKDNPIMDLSHFCIPCCAVTQEWMQVMQSMKGNEELKITQLKSIRY